MSGKSKSALATIAIVWALSQPGVAGACQKWNLGSSFVVRQDNGAVVTVSRIVRNGKNFEAAAKFGSTRGDVTGSISAAGRFKFTIEWGDGSSVGVYTAHIDERGEVQDGRTFDKNHHESWAIWTTTPLTCGDG